GLGRRAFAFASTKHALEVLERYAELKLRKQEVREGMFVAVKDGEVVRKERFRPGHEFVEAEPLPALRAPREREAGLGTLAVLAAAYLAARVHRTRRRAELHFVRACAAGQRGPVDLHVGASPVAVGLAAPGAVEVAVVRAGAALVMADDVPQKDP